MQIKIDKELFQWEQNREVFVDFDEDESRAPYVQFYNSKIKKMSSSFTRRQQDFYTK